MPAVIEVGVLMEKYCLALHSIHIYSIKWTVYHDFMVLNVPLSNKQFFMLVYSLKKCHSHQTYCIHGIY